MSHDEILHSLTGSSSTELAVKQAILLHSDITDLLRIWKDKEDFEGIDCPDGERVVNLPSEEMDPNTEKQVLHLHGAMRKCLGLLHYVIQREDKEYGTQETKYTTQRRTVKDRLENLLFSTKGLLGTEGLALENTPDHLDYSSIEDIDVSFTFKMWTCQVLMELIYWANLAIETLHNFHKERVGTADA